MKVCLSEFELIIRNSQAFHLRLFMLVRRAVALFVFCVEVLPRCEYVALHEANYDHDNDQGDSPEILADLKVALGHFRANSLLVLAHLSIREVVLQAGCPEVSLRLALDAGVCLALSLLSLHTLSFFLILDASLGVLRLIVAILA